eukprot:6211272-Pleurochrysis_carterae.AAC.4
MASEGPAPPLLASAGQQTSLASRSKSTHIGPEMLKGKKGQTRCARTLSVLEGLVEDSLDSGQGVGGGSSAAGAHGCGEGVPGGEGQRENEHSFMYSPSSMKKSSPREGPAPRSPSVARQRSQGAATDKANLSLTALGKSPISTFAEIEELVPDLICTAKTLFDAFPLSPAPGDLLGPGSLLSIPLGEGT